MKRRLPLLLAVLVTSTLACGNTDHGKGGASADKATPAAAADPKVTFDGPTVQWSKEPLSRLTDKVDGVTFSVELPARLKREVKEHDGTFPGYVTWTGPNPFLDPSFTAQEQTFPPADRAAAERAALRGGDPREILRSEDLEGGGFLVSAAETSKKFVSVEVWRPSTSTKKIFRFSLQLRSQAAIDDLEPLRAWMETIAVSFQIE